MKLLASYEVLTPVSKRNIPQLKNYLNDFVPPPYPPTMDQGSVYGEARMPTGGVDMMKNNIMR